MSDDTDAELLQAGIIYRDRERDPDPRRAFPRYAVEVHRGFQASVILGEGASPAEAYEKAKATWRDQPEPRKPSYEELATTAQTWQHIDLVRRYLRVVAVALLERGETHDRSKLDRAEVDAFTKYTPKLKELTYGSAEYKQCLTEMGPALQHHYAANTHHPEHYSRGVSGMDLVSVVEMFVDWLASTQRHADGDIQRSITINQERFGMSDELTAIFRNTVEFFKDEAPVKAPAFERVQDTV